jgi:hypothetical protein
VKFEGKRKNERVKRMKHNESVDKEKVEER